MPLSSGWFVHSILSCLDELEKEKEDGVTPGPGQRQREQTSQQAGSRELRVGHRAGSHKGEKQLSQGPEYADW